MMLNKAKDNHHKVMWAILEKLNEKDTPVYLKGGTALYFFYGLDRFSEDLDFNAKRRINLETKIKDAIRESGAEILKATTKKNTDTVHRIMIHYSMDGVDGRLKVETSFRESCNPQDIVVVRGVRTYPIESLADMKLNAMFGERRRTKARDLYDIRFIMREFPEVFVADRLDRCKFYFSDIDDVESRYRAAFEDDNIIATGELTEIVLGISEFLATQPLKKSEPRSLDEENREQGRGIGI